jgi:hypothetical protein
VLRGGCLFCLNIATVASMYHVGVSTRHRVKVALTVRSEASKSTKKVLGTIVHRYLLCGVLLCYLLKTQRLAERYA